MSAIGNCPWCGGEAKADPIPEWYVECTSAECMASGPFSETRALAIAAWNRLATPGQGEVPTDLDALTELIAAAEECADRAERNARAKCWASTGATIYRQAFADDMAPVDRLRAAVARVRGE